MAPAGRAPARRPLSLVAPPLAPPPLAVAPPPPLLPGQRAALCAAPPEPRRSTAAAWAAPSHEPQAPSQAATAAPTAAAPAAAAPTAAVSAGAETSAEASTSRFLRRQRLRVSANLRVVAAHAVRRRLKRKADVKKMRKGGHGVKCCIMRARESSSDRNTNVAALYL